MKNSIILCARYFPNQKQIVKRMPSVFETSQENMPSTLNQNQKKISSVLNCRIIQPAEFTRSFEDLVFRIFFCAEPMSMHLGLTEPDECIMQFIRQVLQRAKKDGLSLGIYDETSEHDQHHEEKVRG